MSEAAAGRLEQTRKVSLLGWIGLCAICIGYICGVAPLHPANFFGFSQDDTLYFSSAKAIAEGRGYILPSVPGTPPATKYPILYPWILSWVWRYYPSFPANLSSALVVNLGFGAAYLIAAFAFLRRLFGFGDAAALALTAICAANPTVLFLSANLMSDLPFATFALLACVAAARTNEKEAGPLVTVLCGVLTGLSVLIRTMGTPIAAGLFVAIAVRSGWRKAATFAASVLPFILALFYRSLNTPKMPVIAASLCSGSWRITWLYYTSYTGFWRADVLSHGVFWRTVRNNLLAALLQGATYLVKPTYFTAPVFALVLFVILWIVVVRGSVRLASSVGWQPIHLAFGFSVLPILVWDYSFMDRFFLPFLPLILAGIWREVRQVVSQVRSVSKDKGRTEMTMVACFFCFAGAALLWGIATSWWEEVRTIESQSEARAALIVEKREAYSWLKENSSPDATVIAYEDVSLFLYSERQAMRPVTFSPAAGVNRPDVLDSELTCMTSSAEAIHAKYWLVSEDDFGAEWEPAKSRAKEREREMERTLNPIFRSGHGKVRIYKLDANGQPGSSRSIGGQN